MVMIFNYLLTINICPKLMDMIQVVHLKMRLDTESIINNKNVQSGFLKT